MVLFGRSRRGTPAREVPGADLEARAAALLEARRGRKPIQPAPGIVRHMQPILTPLLEKGGVGLSELKRRWPEIVGEKLAKATEPERLAGGILTIKAPGAVAPFVQHQQGLILERVKLAGAEVKGLAIKQGTPAPASGPNVRQLKRALTPAEEAELAQELAGMSDGPLKAALSRLGRAVRQG